MSKIGRNDPCPCGSGKKHKKCCKNLVTPPVRPVPAPKGDELALLMEEGWMLLQYSESAKACDVWLELWRSLKTRFKPGFKDINEADTVFSGCDLIYNWCQDLECELRNAGQQDSTYYQKRITYCRELCSLFPKSDTLLLQNMKRAIAESHFGLGKTDEGIACFESLIQEYPNYIWGYIGWGDMYVWPMMKGIEPDHDRAEHIYGLALNKGMEHEDALLERISDLKNERREAGSGK